MEQHVISFIKKPSTIRSLYIIGCMVISFGLGIITEYSILTARNNPIIQLPEQPIPLTMRYKNPQTQNSSDYATAIDLTAQAEASLANSQPSTILQTPTETQNFVASKTGTKYYPAGCGGIDRIKPDNRVYFATEKDAQDKGYTRTDTCK